VQGNVSLRGDPGVTILIDGKASSLFQGDNKGQALQQLPADETRRARDEITHDRCLPAGLPYRRSESIAVPRMRGYAHAPC